LNSSLGRCNHYNVYSISPSKLLTACGEQGAQRNVRRSLPRHHTGFVKGRKHSVMEVFSCCIAEICLRLNPLYHRREVQPCQCSLADDVGKSHSGRSSKLVQWLTPLSWPSVVIHFHLRSCKKCAWPAEGLRGPRRTFEVGLNRIEVAARPRNVWDVATWVIISPIDMFL